MSFRSSPALVALTVAVASASDARASDLLVDATGAGGAYTSIDQAMAVAVPGDRILVAPGTYSHVDFTVGVSIIGLGTDATQVVIPDMYFHISDPTVGYDAVLQNVTMKSSDPSATLLIYGNENGPGSFTMDGVRVEGGGVYLRGGDHGFFVHISNSEIVPKQGYGFSGEACFVGGNGTFVEIRNTKIVGWDALPAWYLPAGIGLRLFGGTHARIVGSEILGGNGVESSDATYAAGGDAINFGLSGDIDLLLNGGTTATGGSGFKAKGGDGVELNGSIFVGNATIAGGAGVPAGTDFPLTQPTWLTTDRNLTLDPVLEFAQGTPFIVSGQNLSISMASGYVSAITIGFAFDVPASKQFFALSPVPGLIFVPGHSVAGTVPTIAGYTEQGLMLYAQGLLIDPGTGKLQVTNAATIRIDLQ